jgi:CRISPR-associated endonuclease/helicase Cas3
MLHSLMPEGTVHLSALMCPEHRSEVIAGIKSKLKENIPVRVISTQLLEAGVDIDFPVVFRAFTGLDSIAQAAGRCNREGKLERGQVFVFNPPKPPPTGMMLKAEQAGQEMFRVYPELAASLMPEAFKQYFHLYFNRLNNFDKKQIMDLLAGPDARQFKIQFRTAALRFKLIDDAQQHGLVVRYQSDAIDNKKLIDQEMRKNGMIEEVNGIWVQASANLYDPIFGLDVKATPNMYW